MVCLPALLGLPASLACLLELLNCLPGLLACL
jgi:hypothetical protein